MDEREELLEAVKEIQKGAYLIDAQIILISKLLNHVKNYLRVITGIVVFFTGLFAYEYWVAQGLYGLPWW
ncbi:hypothetical protein N9B85_00515 [bacterium]|nr:hypothetical protein [bacterium]